MFSTPNIVTALCIEAQKGALASNSLFWSNILLIGALFMLILAHCLSYYSADESSELGTFFRKYSNNGLYMPFIFNIRLVAITIMLFVYQLT